MQTHGLSEAELDQIIFSNKLGKEKGHETFWSEISKHGLSSYCSSGTLSYASGKPLRCTCALLLLYTTMSDGHAIHSLGRGLGRNRKMSSSCSQYAPLSLVLPDHSMADHTGLSPVWVSSGRR